MTKQVVEKIVVNTGIGRLTQLPEFESKVLPAVSQEFAMITGQKPDYRPARQSISGFKLREGAIVGLRVTLRGKRMQDFLNRVIHIVLPRVRDFRGIPKKAIDASGILTIGVREHVSFPEIKPEHSKYAFGLQLTLVPKFPFAAKEDAVRFYQSLGIPFER